MIVVKMKVNRSITADHWKNMAIGVTDEYGNAFRIIKLRWNNTAMHKMSEYSKTRGFEDAVIGRNPRNGDIAITYRKVGSAMWQRPVGGVGPFMAEVPQTPRNMSLLASMYGDKLFSIIDADINEIVKSMYEKKVEDMSFDTRKFNEKRIRGMHVSALEAHEDRDTKTPELPVDVERLSVTEQNRLNQIKAQELAQREEALKLKEKEITGFQSASVLDGVLPSQYSEQYLGGMKIFQLRKLAKELGLRWAADEKKDGLIRRILKRQVGEEAPVSTGAGADSDTLDG